MVNGILRSHTSPTRTSLISICLCRNIKHLRDLMKFLDVLAPIYQNTANMAS